MGNNRISKDEYYLNIAKTVLERSTCLRRRYGAVIVNNDEIISTGYNGAPRGETNCIDTGVCERERLNVPKGERYELCIAGDTVVKLLNGEYKTIRDLAENGADDFWIYAIDTDTGKIIPAKARLARKTGHADKMIRITFDNNKSLVCTPDHLILMRDCTYKRADCLEHGDSVMPMYYNFAVNNAYESVCNTISMREGRLGLGDKCNTNQTPTHHLVHEYIDGNDWDREKQLLHHRDENKRNNEPDNIIVKDRDVHSREHVTPDRVKNLIDNGYKGRETFRERLINDPEFFESVSQRGKENMTRNWENPDFVERMRDIQSENGRNTMEKINKDPEMRLKMGAGKVIKGVSLLMFRMSDAEDNTPITTGNYDKLQSLYRSEGRGGDQIPKLKTVLKYFDSLDLAIEQAKTYNHKVLYIEEIDFNDDVYDLTVPKFNNFAVDLGDNSCVFIHNCVAVHAEQNAIISASRDKMKGATIYIVGENVADGTPANPAPCLICRRMIINAGIEKCIGLVDGKPTEINIKL